MSSNEIRRLRRALAAEEKRIAEQLKNSETASLKSEQKSDGRPADKWLNVKWLIGSLLVVFGLCLTFYIAQRNGRWFTSKEDKNNDDNLIQDTVDLPTVNTSQYSKDSSKGSEML